MASTEELRQYLGDMLDRDPLFESSEIVAQRSAFLGLVPCESRTQKSSRGERLADKDSDAPQDEQESSQQPTERAEVRLALEAVQAEFYRLPQIALEARLAAIQSAAYPDLVEWQQRMQRCAAMREQLQAARQLAANKPVLHGLMVIAIAPAEKAAELRTNRLRKLKPSAAKAAQRILKDYPDLSTLDQDWFKRIRSLRRDIKLASPQAIFGGIGITIYVVLKVIRILTRD